MYVSFAKGFIVAKEEVLEVESGSAGTFVLLYNKLVLEVVGERI